MTIYGTLSLSLTSKCQVSVERIVLDWESEAMRGLDSIPTGGNILSLDFFSGSKGLRCQYWHYCRFCIFVKSPTVSHNVI